MNLTNMLSLLAAFSIMSSVAQDEPPGWVEETVYATRCEGLPYSVPLKEEDQTCLYQVKILTPGRDITREKRATECIPIWLTAGDQSLPSSVRRRIPAVDSSSNSYRQYRQLLDSLTFSNTRWRPRNPLMLVDAGSPFIVLPQQMPKAFVRVSYPQWEKMTLYLCSLHARHGFLPLVVQVRAHGEQEWKLCILTLSNGNLRELQTLTRPPCSLLFWDDHHLLLLYKSIPRFHFSTGWEVIDSHSGESIASGYYSEKETSFVIDYFLQNNMLYGVTENHIAVRLYPEKLP